MRNVGDSRTAVRDRIARHESSDAVNAAWADSGSLASPLGWHAAVRTNNESLAIERIAAFRLTNGYPSIVACRYRELEIHAPGYV
ncbi:MAG TPA: hypothetical protein VFJ20_08680, partial [Gemmatimonadaceae bacterium]|nr:hypothetical protein [Gemmatimonadaceae bacterium]